jgi:2-polyprenyl-6-methoxyphenol hydroxylase-like FAD-dependent oxidoreductase
VGNCWTHRRGLTLLGDAAHLMSPFGGEGVNAAMRDAIELAARLAQPRDWDQAVADYETEIIRVSRKTWQPNFFRKQGVSSVVSKELIGECQRNY